MFKVSQIGVPSLNHNIGLTYDFEQVSVTIKQCFPIINSNKRMLRERQDPIKRLLRNKFLYYRIVKKTTKFHESM